MFLRNSLFKLDIIIFKVGKKKNLHSEDFNDKPIITEEAALTEDTCAQVPPSEVVQPSTVNSFASLDAILENVQASQGEWPREAFRNVLQGKGRMPRRGWQRAHEIFCGKFFTNTSLDEFKKKAQSTLTTTTGRKCSIREFKREASKRLKTIETLFEEKTLNEAKIYNQ